MPRIFLCHLSRTFEEFFANWHAFGMPFEVIFCFTGIHNSSGKNFNIKTVNLFDFGATSFQSKIPANFFGIFENGNFGGKKNYFAKKVVRLIFLQFFSLGPGLVGSFKLQKIEKAQPIKNEPVLQSIENQNGGPSASTSGLGNKRKKKIFCLLCSFLIIFIIFQYKFKF
jgi:hypothetical protein